ncbi:MAG: hemerythrin domain-containing protein [Armatimonadetes bacterium]|nr:hemerythrin domain-containing protein [Armatimonadota bacterium]
MMDLFGVSPTFDDPIGMLRACHRRIERAVNVLERVAEREQNGTFDAEAGEALRQTLYYFSTGVPRHAADEEQSLFPRLRQHDPVAFRSLEALTREHTEADATYRELADLAEELLRTGRFETPEKSDRFRRLASMLGDLYRLHIRAEDEELLPRAQADLSAEEMGHIGTEMAARRGIDWERQRRVVASLESRARRRRGPESLRDGGLTGAAGADLAHGRVRRQE